MSDLNPTAWEKYWEKHVRQGPHFSPYTFFGDYIMSDDIEHIDCATSRTFLQEANNRIADHPELEEETAKIRKERWALLGECFLLLDKNAGGGNRDELDEALRNYELLIDAESNLRDNNPLIQELDRQISTHAEWHGSIDPATPPYCLRPPRER